MNKRKAYHVSLLVLLLIVWLTSGWIALHSSKQWPLTEQVMLNLSEPQITALSNLPEPIKLEVYISRHPQLKRSILRAVEPVQALVPQLAIQWINPDTHPLEVQNRGITKEGQAYLSVADKGQRLEVISPTTLVQVLLSLEPSAQMLIGFTQDNGERALLSDTPGAWLRFYHYFKQSGVSLAVLDTQSVTNIPENIDLLVMADPEFLSPRAQTLLDQYLHNGGNLLYTTDTKHPYLPTALSQLIPLSLYSGTMVDANSRQFGFDNPEFQVVELLADHDISRSLQQSPLLAGAVGLNVKSVEDWQGSALLWSSENSWLETGPIAQTITMDNEEVRGPIPLAVIFTREINELKQSIIVLGDSDLWSDVYFNTGGNRQFAQQILSYFKPSSLSATISQHALADQFLTIDDNWLMFLAICLLIGLPVGLLVFGVLRWRKPCI